jgi:hypothetical protein
MFRADAHSHVTAFLAGQTGCHMLHAGVDAIGAAANEGVLAREAAKGAEDMSPSRFEQRLAAFIIERERRGGAVFGSEEVVQLLRTVAFHDGEAFACEMLGLARQAGDYDIADFDVYREVASTPLNAWATPRRRVSAPLSLLASRDTHGFRRPALPSWRSTGSSGGSNSASIGSDDAAAGG